jgi:hypothetical protein
MKRKKKNDRWHDLTSVQDLLLLAKRFEAASLRKENQFAIFGFKSSANASLFAHVAASFDPHNKIIESWFQKRRFVHIIFTREALIEMLK